MSLKKLFEDKQIYHTHRNVHSSYSLTWFSLSLLFWDTVSIYNLNHYLSSPNMNRQGLFKLDSLDLKDPRSRLRSHCDNRVVSQLAMNFLSVQSHHHKMSFFFTNQSSVLISTFSRETFREPADFNLGGPSAVSMFSNLCCLSSSTSGWESLIFSSRLI